MLELEKVKGAVYMKRVLKIKKENITRNKKENMNIKWIKDISIIFVEGYIFSFLLSSMLFLTCLQMKMDYVGMAEWQDKATDGGRLTDGITDGHRNSEEPIIKDEQQS